MQTALGKELRKIRIEEDERLLDMAAKLDKSASFISALEVGRKSPPTGFEELVIKVYGLAANAAETLRRAASLSRKAFILTPTSSLGRDTAGLMARKIDSLSDEQLQTIRNILLHKE